jgi:hypothetical protein
MATRPDYSRGETLCLSDVGRLALLRGIGKKTAQWAG